MKNFLVVQLARFGDLIQTKRLIKSLESRGLVHLCIDESLVGIANLIYPKAVIHSLPAHKVPSSDGFKRVNSTLQALSAEDFCAVYNLNHAGLNLSIAKLFAPEQVKGYAMHAGQAIHSHWIRKAFNWTQNRTLSPINLVDFWAFFDKLPYPAHLVNPKAIGEGKGIGVVLAGRESRRSLPPLILTQVVRTFFELMGGPNIYLLGSATESPLARQLKRHMPANMLDKVHDLSGKTNWADLIDAVQGLDVVISPDTGTMHLAAHLGIPVQAFFLSSAWCHETGPYGEGHNMWQSVYECAPCLESAPCPINVKCLESFSHKNFLHALSLSIKKQFAKFNTISMPTDLVHYSSQVDELGSAWQLRMGKDIYTQQRLELRAAIAESLGHTLANVPISNEIANKFYDETDWIFEQKLNLNSLAMEE